jgi:AMP-binding enzyme C-terminal domain
MLAATFGAVSVNLWHRQDRATGQGHDERKRATSSPGVQVEAVVEATIIGAPDEPRGEVVEAFVVPGPCVAPSDTPLAATPRQHVKIYAKCISPTHSSRHAMRPLGAYEVPIDKMLSMRRVE